MPRLNSLQAASQLTRDASEMRAFAAYRGQAAVIDRLYSCVVSSQLCKRLRLMPGAIFSDRHAPVRIRNHCDCSCNLTAGKNFTRFVEITLHLCKVPDFNFRPVIHCTPGGITFESATSKGSGRRCFGAVTSENSHSHNSMESSGLPALCRRSARSYRHSESSLYTSGSTASYGTRALKSGKLRPAGPAYGRQLMARPIAGGAAELLGIRPSTLSTRIKKLGLK